MTNLTITVDERTLRRARVRALEGTPVNAVLGAYREEYAGVRRGAGRELFGLFRGSGPL